MIACRTLHFEAAPPARQPVQDARRTAQGATAVRDVTLRAHRAHPGPAGNRQRLGVANIGAHRRLGPAVACRPRRPAHPRAWDRPAPPPRLAFPPGANSLSPAGCSGSRAVPRIALSTRRSMRKRDHAHHRGEDGPFEPSRHTTTHSHDVTSLKRSDSVPSRPAATAVAGLAGRHSVRIRALAGPLPFSCTTQFREKEVGGAPLVHRLGYLDATRRGAGLQPAAYTRAYRRIGRGEPCRHDGDSRAKAEDGITLDELVSRMGGTT